MCLALGEPDPDALLARLRPSVVGEWLAYFRINPWGAERGDLRMGVLASALLGVKGAKVQGRRPRPSDFMPYHESHVGAADAETLSRQLRAAFGGNTRKP